MKAGSNKPTVPAPRVFLFSERRAAYCLSLFRVLHVFRFVLVKGFSKCGLMPYSLPEFLDSNTFWADHSSGTPKVCLLCCPSSQVSPFSSPLAEGDEYSCHVAGCLRNWRGIPWLFPRPSPARQLACSEGALATMELFRHGNGARLSQPAAASAWGWPWP